MIRGVDYIGKYALLETHYAKSRKENVDVPVLYTDNCREVVWYANSASDVCTPVNICGERDFYKDEGKWHSFEL